MSTTEPGTNTKVVPSLTVAIEDLVLDIMAHMGKEDWEALKQVYAWRQLVRLGVCTAEELLQRAGLNARTHANALNLR